MYKEESTKSKGQGQASTPEDETMINIEPKEGF